MFQVRWFKSFHSAAPLAEKEEVASPTRVSDLLSDPDGKRRKRNRETSFVIPSWRTSSVAFVFGSF
jgi:hypothetical protein